MLWDASLLLMKVERICYVCRVKHERSDLIRVYREKKSDGSFTYKIDRVGNANGRGCHICKGCVEQAKKKRVLNRSFKTNVPQEIYDQL